MSLTKVNYIDNSTIITAKNLNDIQDNIIQNAELIKKIAPMELLWENASPTSEFAAQTINYNFEISENDLVLVIGSEFNTTPNHMYNSCSSTICYIGARGILHFAYSEGGSMATRYRYFLPSTTGIEFGGAYAVKSSGAAAVNNQKCIPQRIYVIKGVST